jgi:hypothetical protein
MARLGHCSTLIASAVLVACLSVLGCANAASTAPRGAASPAAATATLTRGQTPTLIPDNEVTPPVATVAVAATTTQPPTPVPTFSSIPTVPPAPADEPGVTYGQPTQLPAVSEKDAIATARTASGSVPEMATLPREQFSAVYVLWTDLSLNVSNELGTPVARAQPVWIVTAHGLTTIPNSSIPGQTPTAQYASNGELNVVINAMTGAWITTYTYK